MSETWLSCDVKLAGASSSGPPPEIQLQDFLRKFGLVGANPRSDEDFMQRIWSNLRNRDLHTPTYRDPYRLVDGDRLQVPTPDLPPDMSLRTYTFTGAETSVEKVCTEIISSYPPEGLLLLGIPKEDFDPAFLEGILQNQAFFLAHPGPQYNGPFSAGETLYYPVRERRREYRDIAPATALQEDTRNCVTVGEGIFVVKVDLAEDDQVLKLVSKHGESTTKWRPGKVRFKVSFKNRARAETALRTTFQILDAQGAVYYTEVHREGDWLTPGEREWTWDGFMTSAPTSGQKDDRAGFDTRVLRGKLTVSVIVESVKGPPSRAWLYLDNQAANGKFVDAWLVPGDTEIKAMAYVQYEQINEDLPLIVTVALGAAIVAGLLMAIEVFVFWLLDVLGKAGLLPQGAMGAEQAVLLGTAALVAIAALVASIVAVSKTHLSEQEFIKFKQLMTQGIAECWSHRTADLPISGINYRLTVQAQQRKEDAVKMCCMKPLFEGQRGVNLGMVLPMYPVILAHDPMNAAEADAIRSTAAHEFGHSVLAAAVDGNYSITHKGTTGGITSQSPGPAAPSPSSVPAGSNFDLMIYYKDDGTYSFDYDTRQRAVVEDANDFVRIAEVKFRKYRLVDKKLVTDPNRRF